MSQDKNKPRRMKPSKELVQFVNACYADWKQQAIPGDLTVYIGERVARRCAEIVRKDCSAMGEGVSCAYDCHQDAADAILTEFGPAGEPRCQFIHKSGIVCLMELAAPIHAIIGGHHRFVATSAQPVTTNAPYGMDDDTGWPNTSPAPAQPLASQHGTLTEREMTWDYQVKPTFIEESSPAQPAQQQCSMAWYPDHECGDSCLRVPVSTAPAGEPAQTMCDIGKVHPLAEAFAWNDARRADEAQRNPWREAVEEACIVDCIDFYPDDAKKTLANLINWEVTTALDPRVSEAAAKLAGSGEAVASRGMEERLEYVAETAKIALDLVGEEHESDCPAAPAPAPFNKPVPFPAATPEQWRSLAPAQPAQHKLGCGFIVHGECTCAVSAAPEGEPAIYRTCGSCKCQWTGDIKKCPECGKENDETSRDSSIGGSYADVDSGLRGADEKVSAAPAGEEAEQFPEIGVAEFSTPEDAKLAQKLLADLQNEWRAVASRGMDCLECERILARAESAERQLKEAEARHQLETETLRGVVLTERDDALHDLKEAEEKLAERERVYSFMTGERQTLIAALRDECESLRAALTAKSVKFNADDCGDIAGAQTPKDGGKHDGKD